MAFVGLTAVEVQALGNVVGGLSVATLLITQDTGDVAADAQDSANQAQFDQTRADVIVTAEVSKTTSAWLIGKEVYLSECGTPRVLSLVPGSSPPRFQWRERATGLGTSFTIAHPRRDDPTLQITGEVGKPVATGETVSFWYKGNDPSPEIESGSQFLVFSGGELTTARHTGNTGSENYLNFGIRHASGYSVPIQAATEFRLTLSIPNAPFPPTLLALSAEANTANAQMLAFDNVANVTLCPGAAPDPLPEGIWMSTGIGGVPVGIVPTITSTSATGAAEWQITTTPPKDSYAGFGVAFGGVDLPSSSGRGRWAACSETAGGFGVSWSDSDGETWAKGISAYDMPACNFVAYGNGTWVALNSSDVPGDNRLLFSTDNGGNWAESSGGITALVGSGRCAAYGNNDIVAGTDFGVGKWFAVSNASNGNNLATSLDGGQTWSGLGTRFSMGGNGIATDGHGNWVAVGVSNTSRETIIRSIDHGVTWLASSSSPSSTAFDAGANGGGFAVSVNPTTGVWIAVGRGSNTALQSTDNGDTWRVSPSPPGWDIGTSIGNNGASPSTLWVAGGSSASETTSTYYSGDNGETWVSSPTNHFTNTHGVAFQRELP